MGYDLHITRAAEDWGSNDGVEISAEDWLRYIRSDPELTLEPENGPYFVRWLGKSNHPEPWLNWRRGNLYSTHPDKALLEKMLAIARYFGARVQGDDGEIYHTTEGYADATVPSRLGR
jgi:DNA-directed RNA polymerase